MAALVRSIRGLMARRTRDEDTGAITAARLREFTAMLRAEGDMAIPRGRT